MKYVEDHIPTYHGPENYSQVVGAPYLQQAFKELRALGYEPFRTFDWERNLWLISDNYRPGHYELTPEEAKAISTTGLRRLLDVNKAKWTFVKDPNPHPDDAWKEPGRYVRIPD